jgi:hypothetical protein
VFPLENLGIAKLSSVPFPFDPFGFGLDLEPLLEFDGSLASKEVVDRSANARSFVSDSAAGRANAVLARRVRRIVEYFILVNKVRGCD